MKIFLLLLAFELALSDKLDRKYLPPPGAKYSGGTLDDLHPPLEYPNQAYPGANLYKPETETYNPEFNGVPPVSNEYAKLQTPNNFRTTTLTPTRSSFGKAPLKPESGPNVFNNFPSAFPSKSYLPSKPSLGGQTLITPYSPFNVTPRPQIEAINGNGKFTPRYNKNNEGYYNFVPAIQANKNDTTNPILDSVRSQNLAKMQYPNTNNFNYITPKYKNSAPNEISQNYQPNVFGFYGGNPMIMTSLNQIPRDQFDKNELTRSYYGFGNGKEIMPMTTIRPFLTDSDSIDMSKNKLIFNKPLESTINPVSQNKPQLPSATVRSFPKEYSSKTNAHRNGNRSQSRYLPKRPQTESERNAVIIKYDNSLSPDGYSYSYDTSNGIHAEETATTTNGVRAKGSYSYTGDDGKVYTVTYTADENGFRPQGDHLPTPPPVPEAIKRVIEQAERDKAKGIIDDGSYDESKYGHLNYDNGNKYLSFKKSGMKLPKPNAPNSFKRYRLKNNNNLDKISTSPTKVNPQSQNKNEQNGLILQENKYFSDKPTNDMRNENINKGKNFINADNRSGLKQDVNTEEDLQSRKPITSVTYTDIPNADLINMKNNSTNSNESVAKTPTQVQYDKPEEQSSTSGVTLVDTGYYYVPPTIKFNPFGGNPSYNATVNLSLGVPNNEISMRNAFDFSKSNEMQMKSSINTKPSPSLGYKNIEPTTTRKPYISGPESQEKASDIKPDSTIYNDDISTFPNDQNLFQYLPDSTPVISQALDENQPEKSQLFQPTANPTLFDETLPSTVENRVNIPPTKPGITVSQDFITTIRPDTFKDGVLEVKQNVKIYTLKGPETDNGYPENNLGYNNDIFYPTSTPNGITNFFETSSAVIPGLEQIPEIIQESPAEYNIFGDKYISTAEPQPNNVVIPENYSNNAIGQISRSETESQGYSSEIPAIPFPPNPSGIEREIPGPDFISPTINNLNPNSVIGEDFSGPRQGQKFDPNNGYYY